MLHFGDFYLTEIKTQVTYDKNWLISGKTYVRTCLHIHNTTNAVVVNSDEAMINHTTFKIFMRRMVPDTFKIYAFEFADSGGNMGVTRNGYKLSMTLFGAIESVFEKMVEVLPKDSIVVFAAENDSVRNKIYKRFYDKILAKYPFPVTYADMENNKFPLQTDFQLYGFAKQKRTLKILRGEDIITNIKKKFKK